MGRERGASGAWAGCVHWFGQICTFKRERPGEMGARGANLPKKCIFHASPSAPSPAPASPPLRHRSPTADCRLCAPGASAAPVLHPAWQNPAPASPPHRSPTADCATPDSAAPSPPVRTACPPHPVLPDHPQTLTPPANSETPRPPNGRRGVNTQRGVSARRLTRQLRKSPRPQRRHLRCRLLARPLRERQRPQEQQC